MKSLPQIFDRHKSIVKFLKAINTLTNEAPRREKQQQSVVHLPERLASLGIMADLPGAPMHHSTIVLKDTRGSIFVPPLCRETPASRTGLIGDVFAVWEAARRVSGYTLKSWFFLIIFFCLKLSACVLREFYQDFHHEFNKFELAVVIKVNQRIYTGILICIAIAVSFFQIAPVECVNFSRIANVSFLERNFYNARIYTFLHSWRY